MARSKVKLKLNGLEKLRKEFSSGPVLDEIGKAVVKGMREAIAIGLSPVAKVGRFDGYAAQRKAGLKPASQLYPNSVKRKFPAKQTRPVNLSLNNKFLNTLGYQKKARLEVGHIIFDDKTKALFEAHNEGLHPDVPQRQYLPNKRGENFLVSIQRLIKDIIVKTIKRNS